MLRNLFEHGRFLRRWHARSGNHQFTELVALAVLAAAWPEFKGSGEWLEYATDRACRALIAQTYPDDAHVGVSNRYHRVVLLEAERLAAVLRITGRETQLKQVGDRLEAMWGYFAGVCRPDGYGPLNNDGDLEPNAWYLANAAKRWSNSDWLNIATADREGTAPSDNPANRYFLWSGQGIMRSGWDTKAHWARLELGPHGTNHQHHDQLSLELFAGGRSILVDPGRCTFQRGRAREHFREAVGHNVIRVNGKGSVPPRRRATLPAAVRVVRNLAYDFFSRSAQFGGNPLTIGRGCEWRRAVLFLRGKYWIVVDHLDPKGRAGITASWLFHPECTVVVDADHVFTQDRGKRNLAIVPTAVTEFRAHWRPSTLAVEMMAGCSRFPAKRTIGFVDAYTCRICDRAKVPGNRRLATLVNLWNRRRLADVSCGL